MPDLLKAWEAWDRWALTLRSKWNLSPREGELEAQRMEDASAAVAKRLGLTTTEFRVRLVGLRREGMTREAALAQVINQGA